MCQGQLTFGSSHFLTICSQVRGSQLLPYADVGIPVGLTTWPPLLAGRVVTALAPKSKGRDEV